MAFGKSHSKAEQLLAQLRESWLDELPSRIEALENQVLALRGADDFEARFEALYRDVHSMKGTAGTYGLHVFTPICHLFEDLLSRRFTGADAIADEDLALAMSCIDFMREGQALAVSAENDFSALERRVQALGRRASAGSLRVLLVENSRSARDLCMQVLQSLGSDVVTASDGQVALGRLLHEPFDLLVTGAEVGTLGGEALVAAVRLSHSINRDIRTILLTLRDERAPVDARPDRIIHRDADLVASLGEYVRGLREGTTASSQGNLSLS